MASLEIGNFHFDLKIAQFYLSLHLYEEDGGYVGRFEYCTDLFEAETVERLSSNFPAVVTGHCQRPAAKDSEDSDVGGIGTESGGQRVERHAGRLSSACLMHELFEAQAGRTPERTALGGRRRRSRMPSWTSAPIASRRRYVHTVWAVANGSACASSGAPTWSPPCSASSRAGAAYVPLDPAFPAERLRFMAEDAELTLLVSSSIWRIVSLYRAHANCCWTATQHCSHHNPISG